MALAPALLLAAVTACSSPAGAEPGAESVRVEGVPHVRQLPDLCGEACAEMALRRLGADWDQRDVFDATGVDPSLGRGAWTPELRRALVSIGFEPGQTWFTVNAGDDEAIAERWDAVRRALQQGVPSILCTRWDDRPGASEHFRLVTGYDAAEDRVLYHDPAVDGGAYLEMDREDFLDLWPLRYSREHWTLVAMELRPGEIREPPGRSGRTAVDYALHVMVLRETLPEGYTAVVEEPFVVVGNEPPDRVARRAEGTVRWAVDRLRADFFQADPRHVHDVWLHRDGDSYLAHSRRLLGGPPGTPYGFALPEQRVLVMDISTGSGTLVHELVHPFVRADLLDPPPWIDEGLASLLEACTDRDGHITGLVNWRLGGLKEALLEERVPPARELAAMDAGAFYGPGAGVHYAQARYLMLHLQERDALRPFYARVRASREEDPTGYQALLEAVDAGDDPDWEEEWAEWVLDL